MAIAAVITACSSISSASGTVSSTTGAATAFGASCTGAAGAFFLLLVSQNVIKRRNNENQENQHNKYGADSDDGVHAGLADQNAL